MAQKLDSLYIDLDARLSGLEKGLGDAQGKLNKSGKGFKKWSANILKVGVTAAVGVGAGLLKIGDDFDKAVRQIKIGTGATGDTLKQLKKDFDAVFADVPDDAGKVANVLATLNTATGATGKVLQDLTEAALDASRVLGEDAATNAATFGQVLNQFSVPAEKGVELMDDLFQITQDYGLGLGQLTNGLKTYGSVMTNAGFSVEETAVLMGRMNKAGLDWSRISPGLNKAFRDMAKSGIDGKKGLDAAIKAIKGASTETEALNIATTIFGAEGAQRMTRGIRDGVFSLDDLTGALKNNTGLLEKTEQQTRTLGEEFDEMKNELLLMLEPFARDFVRALKNSIPAIKKMISGLADGIKAFITFGENVGIAAAKVVMAWKKAEKATKDLYLGIKKYLVDKFVGIVSSVKQSVDKVGDFFFGLYDAVIGHSYIPDLVNGVDYWMGEKLKQAMVSNTRANTEESKSIFQSFAQSLQITTEKIQAVFLQAFGNLSRGVGDSFAAMVIDGEDFGENMREVWKDMGRMFVSAIVQMTIEWLAFKALVAAGINVGGISGGLGLAGGGGAAGAAGGAGGGSGALGVAGGALIAGGVGYGVTKLLGGNEDDSKAAGVGSAIGFAVGGPVGAVVGGAIGSQYTSIKKGAKKFGNWLTGGDQPRRVTAPKIYATDYISPNDSNVAPNSSTSQTIQVNLDGRQISKNTVQHMPSVLRLQGVAV